MQEDCDLYGAAVAVGALYAALLQPLHKWYSPNYIWVTVVGGNVLIAGFLQLLARRNRFPRSVVGSFTMLNIALGTPIILWQLGQHYARFQARRVRRMKG
jgi:hypothetical protein